MCVSVSEYDIIDSVSPEYVRRHRSLFAAASLIVIDATTEPITSTLSSVGNFTQYPTPGSILSTISYPSLALYLYAGGMCIGNTATGDMFVGTTGIDNKFQPSLW